MRYSFRSYHYIDTSRLKDCIDPIDFYTQEGQEVAIRGCGHWKLAGLCPFHADRHSGSFYINGDNGAFRCFSCDARGGDIISFVQMKYEVTFKDAVVKLAEEWRVT